LKTKHRCLGPFSSFVVALREPWVTRNAEPPWDRLVWRGALASRRPPRLPPTGLQPRRRSSEDRPSQLRRARRPAIALLQTPVPRRISHRSIPRRIPGGEKGEPHRALGLQGNAHANLLGPAAYFI